MLFFHAIITYNFCVMMTTQAPTLEVSGEVGGEVVIQCSSRGPTENGSSLYFCKETCSNGNILIQARNKKSSVTRRGRYSLVVRGSDGFYDVVIKRLRREDEGRYICEGHNILHKNITLAVFDATTVPSGSLSFSPSQQTQDELLPEAISNSSSRPASEASASPPTERTGPKTGTISDTTLVIIVSVSLALVVCAIIPFILYGNWRSNARASIPPAPGKIDADESSSMRLQSLGSDVSSSQDAAQYTAAYQALDQNRIG